MANKKVSQLTSKPSVLTTDLFPIADPSTGQLYKTTISDLGTAIGSGVSSVNGLVGAVVLDTDDIQELVSPTNKWFTDTRARAALSASSPLTYNSGTGVFGIQVANGSQNGYLSSADWTTFNSKQAALSGTGFVKSTGGTISYDTNTYLTTANAAATYLPLGGGTMTGALFGASASFSGYVGFNGNTSPLYPVDVAGSGRFSGDLRIESTNPRIYLTDTDNNPDYFISNTDGTFTVYDVTNSTARFTIGTTGNANFSNAITGAGSISGASLYATTTISAGNSASIGGNGGVGGVVNIYKSNSWTVAGDGYTSLYSGTGFLGVIDTTGSTDKRFYLSWSSLTTSTLRTYTLPDTSGTIALTSNLSSYLPLSGGTLTGALSGTSATFSGLTVDNNQNGSTWVIAKNQNVGSGAAAGFLMTNNTGDLGAISLLSSGNSPANGLFIRTLSTNSLILGTNSTANLTIASGGAATFSSSVSATSVALNGSIANSADAATLTIKQTSTSYNNGIYLERGGERNGYHMYIGGSVDSLNFRRNYFGTQSDVMSLTRDGNVGIGTTGSAWNLFTALDIGTNVSLANYTDYTFLGTNVYYSSSNDWRFKTTGYGNGIYLRKDDGNILFTTFGTGSAGAIATGSERMRITSDGNLLFNTTNNNGSKVRLSAATGWTTEIINNNASNQQLFMLFTYGSTGLGSIQGNGSIVSYYSTSDYRLKEDLKFINGLEIVNKIKVYDYKWKNSENRMDGVLAHELAEVLPYAVSGVKDGEQMQQVDYSKIVPVMVQAIKDLKAELDTLKNK